MELKHMGYYEDGKYEIMQESISGVLYAMQNGEIVAQGGDMIEIIEVIRNELENGPRITGTNKDDLQNGPRITGTNKDEEYKKALTENSSIEETVPSVIMDEVQKEYINIEEKDNNISNEIEQ